MQFPPNPYLSACWMVQRLTSKRLASSRWLTPSDRSTRMYSRCCSVRLGRRPGKRPSARAFAWPATERSLIEFRHHSLKASTIESWSLPMDVAVSKSSASPAVCRSAPWRDGRCGCPPGCPPRPPGPEGLLGSNIAHGVAGSVAGWHDLGHGSERGRRCLCSQGGFTRGLLVRNCCVDELIVQGLCSEILRPCKQLPSNPALHPS